MLVQCERCKLPKECRFYGRPSDVEADKSQNGEWLCEKCVPLRAKELDEAIAKMRSLLRED